MLATLRWRPGGCAPPFEEYGSEDDALEPCKHFQREWNIVSGLVSDELTICLIDRFYL